MQQMSDVHRVLGWLEATVAHHERRILDLENQKPKTHVPEWLTPQAVVWVLILLGAITGHVKIETLRDVMQVMP